MRTQTTGVAQVQMNTEEDRQRSVTLSLTRDEEYKAGIARKRR